MRLSQVFGGLVVASMSAAVGVFLISSGVENWHAQKHFADRVGTCMGMGCVAVLCLMGIGFGISMMLVHD